MQHRSRESRSHAPSPARRAARGAGFLLGGLLVVGALCLFLANLLVWANGTIFDSEEFVETVDGTLDKPQVKERLASAITTQVFASPAYAEFIDRNFSEQAAALEPIVRSRARALVEEAIVALLDAELTRSARNAALTGLHNQVIGFLENRRDLLEFSDDRLVLDLRDQARRVLDRLDIEPQQTLGGGEDVATEDGGTIVILEEAGSLRRVSWFMQNRGSITAVLALGAFLALGAAFLLHRQARKGLFRVALTVFLVGFVTLLITTVVNLGLRAAMPERTVLREMVRDLLDNLRWQSFLLLAAGAVVIAMSDDRVRSRLKGAGQSTVAAARRVDPAFALLALAGLGILVFVFA